MPVVTRLRIKSVDQREVRELGDGETISRFA